MKTEELAKKEVPPQMKVAKNMAQGTLNFARAGIEGLKTYRTPYAISGEAVSLGWDDTKPPLTLDGKKYTFGADVAVDEKGDFDAERPRSRMTVIRLDDAGKEEMAIAVESFEDGGAWMFEWDLTAEEGTMGDRLEPGDPRYEEVKAFSEVFFAESERLLQPVPAEIPRDVGRVALNP